MATTVKKKIVKAKANDAAATKAKNAKAEGTKLTKKELDTKNIKESVKQAVTSFREVKYRYPEDIATDPLKKKEFRQKTRNKLNKFTLDLGKIDPDSKAYRRLLREQNSFKKEVLLNPEA